MVNRARMPAFGLAAKFRATRYPITRRSACVERKHLPFLESSDISLALAASMHARARARESTEAGPPDRRCARKRSVLRIDRAAIESAGRIFRARRSAARISRARVVGNAGSVFIGLTSSGRWIAVSHALQLSQPMNEPRCKDTVQVATNRTRPRLSALFLFLPLLPSVPFPSPRQLRIKALAAAYSRHVSKL